MPDLPPDLLPDILVRLPVKSLIRFRCISNPISSLIYSPDFTKLHLNRSNSNRSIVIPLEIGCNFYSLNPRSRAQDDPTFTPYGSQNYIDLVIGSCNGLLCLCDSTGQIIIWNPATRKHLNLPSPPFDYTHPLLDPCNTCHGFGYDSLHDDYKVLIIALKTSESDWNNSVFVYSLKLNLWWKISGWFFNYVQTDVAGIFVSGALHFIADQDSGGHWVVAVDLAAVGEEEFQYREVPLPPLCSHIINLGVLEGCLSVTFYPNDGSVGVWVMKDYGVMESWTELISLREDVQYLKPLAYSSGGDEVILDDNACGLVWYDLKMKNLERLGLPERSFAGVSAVYRESLVNSMLITTPDDNLETDVSTWDECSIYIR